LVVKETEHGPAFRRYEAPLTRSEAPPIAPIDEAVTATLRPAKRAPVAQAGDVPALGRWQAPLNLLSVPPDQTPSASRESATMEFINFADVNAMALAAPTVLLALFALFAAWKNRSRPSN
jgi:hypothetical protein